MHQLPQYVPLIVNPKSQQPLVLEKDMHQLPQHVIEHLVGLLHGQRVRRSDNKAEVEVSFGELSALAAGQPRKFTSKERDPETGLDYFGARYGEPTAIYP